MKIFTTKKQKLGQLGERAAEEYLVKQEFVIIDRNFSTRFGEVDIIAQRGNTLYFFEIKAISVSHETISTKEAEMLKDHRNVSRQTFLQENRKLSNPFQNISYFKIKRLCKTAEIYLRLKNISKDMRFQIDGIGVFVDQVSHETSLERIENISII